LDLVTFRESRWYTGKGVETPFMFVSQKVISRVSAGSKLFIGTDSFVDNNGVTFATAICVYGNNSDSFYFFTKSKENINKYKVLISRITEEVRRTIEVADYFYSFKEIESESIEVHIDASPFGTKNATSKFSEMLKGYVKGAGYECKLKPYAWASQSVADKHSK